jgi:hypothetical protein
MVTIIYHREEKSMKRKVLALISVAVMVSAISFNSVFAAEKGFIVGERKTASALLVAHGEFHPDVSGNIDMKKPGKVTFQLQKLNTKLKKWENLGASKSITFKKAGGHDFSIKDVGGKQVASGHERFRLVLTSTLTMKQAIVNINY